MLEREAMEAAVMEVIGKKEREALEALKARGYILSTANSTRDGLFVFYEKRVDNADVPPGFPMEEVEKISVGPTILEYGVYVSSFIFVNGEMSSVQHTFSFSFVSENQDISTRVVVGVNGFMDTPHPEGRTSEYKIIPVVQIGPLPGARTPLRRRKRVNEAVIRAAAYLNPVAQRYPEANVFAIEKNLGGKRDATSLRFLGVAGEMFLSAPPEG